MENLNLHQQKRETNKCFIILGVFSPYTGDTFLLNLLCTLFDQKKKKLLIY